jgi:hypothetical protein
MTEQRGTTTAGVAYVLLDDEIPAERLYPKTGVYQFTGQPGPVFEMGGYNDMTVIDPLTGARHYVARAMTDGQPLVSVMRGVIASAEAAGFMSGYGPTPAMAYQFGEFAGPVTEYDECGGISLIDPWSGKRLRIDGLGGSVWADLRAALTVAYEVGFMSESDGA